MADQDRYSRQQLAEMFNRSITTIDRWRKRGIIPEANRTLAEPWWTDTQIEEARKRLSSFVAIRHHSSPLQSSKD